NEPKQWEILRQMGIPDREIPKFADPMHWIEVFPAGTMADLKALGAAVDWTRSFITTPLNPPYDAFVRWQFLHLKAGGYVKIDKHPVIWCPKDQAPIAGSELHGWDAVASAINRAIPILPSSFIDQGRGTGIVTSVPSDAPDDYVALRDLQQDDAQLAKYGLDAERVRGIKPIPIIR